VGDQKIKGKGKYKSFVCYVSSIVLLYPFLKMILIHRFHFLHMVCSDGRKGNKNGKKAFVYSKGCGTKDLR